MIVISHDRYFLDRVCGRMAELLMGSVETYDGNYTEYLEKRTAVYEIRMKAWQLQQKEIARQEAIIEMYRRFNREKSIRAAESKQKRLDKIERLEKPQEENQVRFRFETRRRTGDDVLITEGLRKGYGERVLFSDLKNKTVLDEVWDRFPRMEQYEVRGALGLFLFTGDDVFAPVSTLSGGEKGRVALTELMLRKDNVLLLDEPTNHLDMDSREVLEDALSGFPGTIIAVSHDRYFINRFAEKVWVLDGQEIREYLGNYDRYFMKVSRDQEPDGNAPQQTRTAMEKEKRKSREEEKRAKELKEKLKALEQAIARAEEEAGRLEKELADPETWKNPEAAAETTRRYNALKAETEDLYEQYDALESIM